MRGNRTAALTLCALLSGAAASAQEPRVERWIGFLQLREHFPLTTGYLVLEPTSGFTLEAGAWELEATLSLSNTFTASRPIERALSARERRAPFTREMFEAFAAVDPFDQTFYIDAEVVRTALRARRGLGGGFELGLLLPIFEVHGGSSDGLVEGFHDLFGFDQEGRQGVERHAIAQLVSGQGVELDLGGSGVEPGDLVLTLKKRLLAGDARYGLLVELDLKLPTGDEEQLLSSGATDVGLSFVGSRCWRSRCGHAMAGWVFAGTADALPTDSQDVFSGALAFEQALPAGWALVVQAQYWQSYLDRLAFEHFAEDTIQLGASVTRSTGWGVFLAGLSENSFSFKNSADVSFHVGWRKGFD